MKTSRFALCLTLVLFLLLSLSPLALAETTTAGSSATATGSEDGSVFLAGTNAASSATGTLHVANGELAIGPNGSWLDASAVEVTGGTYGNGNLVLTSAEASVTVVFPDKADPEAAAGKRLFIIEEFQGIRADEKFLPGAEDLVRNFGEKTVHDDLRRRVREDPVRGVFQTKERVREHRDPIVFPGGDG